MNSDGDGKSLFFGFLLVVGVLISPLVVRLVGHLIEAFSP